MKLNQITCIDCVEGMKQLEDNCVDCTVSSPPYDLMRKYHQFTFNFENVAKELFRVTKDGGVVVWIVGDAVEDGSETGTSFKQALYFKEIGFAINDTMIYEKAGFVNPSRNRYNQIFEYMFIFSKGKPKTFNPIKDRPNKWAGHTRWGNGGRRNPDGTMTQIKENKVYADFGMRTNIWRYVTGRGNTTKDKICYGHPAMFPEKLAQDHILSWSNPGDLVLDPFMGSGTTAKMAKLNGRNYLGFEISQEYCDLANKRLELS